MGSHETSSVDRLPLVGLTIFLVCFLTDFLVGWLVGFLVGFLSAFFEGGARNSDWLPRVERPGRSTGGGCGVSVAGSKGGEGGGIAVTQLSGSLNTSHPVWPGIRRPSIG